MKFLLSQHLRLSALLTAHCRAKLKWTMYGSSENQVIDASVFIYSHLCRRKKPAWATTGVSQDHQDDSCNTSSEEHSVYTSDPQHARHGHTPHAESAIDESAIAAANTAPHVPHVQNSTAASEASFGADNAASAAVATADSHSTPTTNSHGSSDRHSAHVRPHTSDAHHHAPAPKQGSFGQGSSSNSPAAASAKPAPSQMTFEAMLQRFQEPTLGSILRDSTIATESAQKVTEKAARAADDALPPFVTTSSSPQSTSRLHLDSKGTRSRPTSADDSLYGQHLESQPQAPHAELGELSCCRLIKAHMFAMLCHAKQGNA